MSTNGQSNGEPHENSDDTVPKAKGGLGGIPSLTDGIRDIRLIKRAAQQQWDMPEQVYKVLPIEMLLIAANRANPGKQIAASRTLATFHAQNQADDPAVQQHAHTGVDLSYDDLVRIAAGDAPAGSNGTGS